MQPHEFSPMQLQEQFWGLNVHALLSPVNQVILFYLNSIKEMLMTQADRFSKEEVSMNENFNLSLTAIQ